jgi:hypothetical protein
MTKTDKQSVLKSKINMIQVLKINQNILEVIFQPHQLTKQIRS